MKQGTPLTLAPCEPHHYRKKIVAREIREQRTLIETSSKKLLTIKKRLDSKQLLTIPTHVHISNRKSDSHIKYLRRLNAEYTAGIETLRKAQDYLKLLIEESKLYT